MQNTYKILSLLLDYPSNEVKENLTGIMDVIEEEAYLSKSQCRKLQVFLDYAQSLPLAEWQMQYVQLFDFSSNSNLYLFDHVYGDSRERGQAMVDLTEMYTQSGFMPCSNELPDYLPLFLEYLSLLKVAKDSETLLKEVSHVLANMKKALEKKETPYQHLLDILCSLPGSVETGINEKKGVEV
jgi:nitrate reductase molybdenum cofactor assembly chaperone